MDDTKEPLREMDVGEFVRRFKNKMDENEDIKFVFFLGAGCSVSSGIPAAGELVRNWLPRLKRLKTGDNSNYEDWAKEHYLGYDGTNDSLFYGNVINDLFLTSDGRQREIERLTEGKDPSFGYAVLAKLMSHRKYGRNCNAVLTVNFDDLVADALYLYTHKKPLIISHDSLVGFVRITRMRPLVIKLHGDALLEPRNTKHETSQLPTRVKEVLKNFLSETALIFVGYGGNDKSIAEILNELPEGSLPWGIYWIGNKIPENNIGQWLRKRNAIWVTHRDFDELMLLIWDEFNLDHPDEKRFNRLTETYYQTFNNLKNRLEGPEGENSVLSEALKKAVEVAINEAVSAWSIKFTADQYIRTDPERADIIYQKGMEKFPKSIALIGSYAEFLAKILKDYDKDEDYYKMALEPDPDDPDIFWKESIANNIGNYAGFLLAKGDEKGFDFLSRAIKLAEDNLAIINLLLECQFYRYAHIKDLESRKDALNRIRELLLDGVRSPGWDLSENVKRAIEDGHPHPDFLALLSKVISKEIDINELDKFEEWNEK